MPTFNALQCYRCNMMQVKHEKKSSNKWTCCVCNEKQSVRKIFARSEAAKDVRKFVQEFNFSRQSAEAKALAKVAEIAPEMEEFEAWEGTGCIQSDSNDLKDLKSFQSQYLPVNRQSVWDSYIPSEGYGAGLEPLEDLSEDEKFVTSFPDSRASKRKCKTATLSDELRDHFPLKRTPAKGKPCFPSNERNENFLRQSSYQRRNDSLDCNSTILSCQQTEHLPKSALKGRISSGFKMQTTKAIGLSEGCENWPLHASTKQLPQKRTTQVHIQRTDKTEAKLKPESKWAKFLESDEPAIPEPERTQGESSVWSVKSSNDWQSFDGLMKTELDDLLSTEILFADGPNKKFSWDNDE